MNLPLKYFLCFCCTFLFSAGPQKKTTPATGIIKFSFHNTVGGIPLLLDSSTYTNPFGETYTVTKFKYYISNITLSSVNGIEKEKESYHLVDQADPGSLSFSFETGENSFSGLHFLIGIDSLHNVSGAQSGALDPLNDMFWTWHSGYVMAKMEGTSPVSGLQGNIIQYHIGGFNGVNNVLRGINLDLLAGKSLIVKPGQTSEIMIEADFNKWWQSPNDIKIKELPICATPGPAAKNIADNYCRMFRVTSVVNN